MEENGGSLTDGETKESENRMHGEPCRMGNKETPQDLPHEWTGSTKFRKSWRALSEQTQSKQQRSGVGSACIATPMRDTASLVEEEPKYEIDLRAESDILDLRATSQQGK